MQDKEDQKKSENTLNIEKMMNEIIIDEDENKIFIGINHTITDTFNGNDYRRKINKNL